MADVVFNTYLQHLPDDFGWSTSPIMCAILDSQTWTPDKTDPFVATPIAAGAVECAAPSYARVALTSAILTPDAPGNRTLFQGSIADFGTLETGFDFDTFVLYVAVTDDSDSYLIAAYDVGAQTTAGTAVRFVPDTSGFFELLQP